jgi:putative endonuclease
MYTVYVIQSVIDGRLYKGFTNDLERRLNEHNQGRVKSTAKFIPWKVVYTEKANSSIEARAREKFFKSGKGREFLKKLLKEDL